MRKKLHISVVIFFTMVVGFFSSCEMEEKLADRGALLAEVADKKLYENDLSFLFQNPNFDGDSAKTISSYISRWVREQAILVEAEKNVVDTEDINRKVSDYREALLSYTYEKKRLDQKVDTAILRMEVEAFYEEQPDQFLASKMQIQLRLVAFDPGRNNIWPLRNEVYNRDISERELEEIVELNEGEWILNPYFWYSFDVVDDVTENRLNQDNITAGYEFSYNEDGNRYFLKVLEVVEEGEPMPFMMVEDKIRQLIHIQRRNELLSTIRNEAYEKQMRNQQVKIHFP